MLIQRRCQHYAAPIVAVLLVTASAFAADHVTGVSNFHKVNDNLYRGGQPTAEGFKALAHLGIKTIVDLRGTGDRSLAEQKAVEAAGMKYVSVPFRGMSAPTSEEVMKVLALIDDKATGPVFIHCRRGADRTGTVIACYRISHDHWDNDKALHEAKSCGMSRLERAMQGYVRHYKPAAASAGPGVSAPASGRTALAASSVQ